MGVDLFISPNCDLFLKWGNYTMVTSQKTRTIKSYSLLKTLEPMWIIGFVLICFYWNLKRIFKLIWYLFRHLLTLISLKKRGSKTNFITLCLYTRRKVKGFWEVSCLFSNSIILASGFRKQISKLKTHTFWALN